MAATVLDFMKGLRILRAPGVHRATMARLRDQWAVKRAPGHGAWTPKPEPDAA